MICKFLSYSVSCLFTFWLVFFDPRVFNFDEAQFVSFIARTLGFIAKKPLPNNTGSHRFTLMFSSITIRQLCSF